MAVTKTILKKTHQEAVVKVAGTADSATIDLAADLLPSGQALDGETQTVNITAVTWTGATGSLINISRGGANVLTLAGEAAAEFQFNESGFVDSVDNTGDITVTISGAEAQVYVILRKVGGYATKIETATFGAYDDETAVGS